MSELDFSEFFDQVAEDRADAKRRATIIQAAALPGGQRRRIDALIKAGQLEDYEAELSTLSDQEIIAEGDYRAMRLEEESNSHAQP
jgi:hypothetical protein